jgi:hypothetical protein
MWYQSQVIIGVILTNDGIIEGVAPHLVDGGLSILQYVDDTILFMEHDLAKDRNLKLILSAFEQIF